MIDKAQYKVLIQQYMDKYQVSYTQAAHLLAMDQIDPFFNISMT